MRKGFDVKGAILRTMMVLVITAIGFGLAGCGEEMAKLEEKQLKSQAEVETNARQLAALSERIEQNQQQLSAGLEGVQNNIRNVAVNNAAVSEEQVKLQEAMQNSNRQTTNKIALLEQGRNELQARIEAVQDNTQNVAADMGADITNVKDEQARLYETMQSNSRQFTNSVAVIEQNQQQWQSKIEELHQNFQEVTTQMSTLGNDLLKLQEVLQSNIREMAVIMDVSGKEQTKFQEKIRSDLLAFNSSLSAIRQSQETLQSQIEIVQSSAEIMSNELPAAIEQLREQVDRNSSTETEENQPPPETNSVE
jgi:DNA repair exonuclease SbcCD ATPase subunit